MATDELKVGDMVKLNFTYGDAERAIDTVYREGIVTLVEKNDDGILHMVTPVDEYFEGHWVSPTGGDLSNVTNLGPRLDYLLMIAERIEKRGYGEKAKVLKEYVKNSL